MPIGEWIGKIAGAAVAYLALFILFGAPVYAPLAHAFDPAAFLSEQHSIPASGAALVIPTELARGAVWVLVTVPAILALPCG